MGSHGVFLWSSELQQLHGRVLAILKSVGAYRPFTQVLWGLPQTLLSRGTMWTEMNFVVGPAIWKDSQYFFEWYWDSWDLSMGREKRSAIHSFSPSTHLS